MKHVSLLKARVNIAELLDEVERGETLQISREGKLDADVSPPVDEERQEKARQAVRGLIELRKNAPRATVEEVLQWRDEGRRY